MVERCSPVIAHSFAERVDVSSGTGPKRGVHQHVDVGHRWVLGTVIERGKRIHGGRVADWYRTEWSGTDGGGGRRGMSGAWPTRRALTALEVPTIPTGNVRAALNHPTQASTGVPRDTYRDRRREIAS